jgi:hypothetical protein
MVKKSKIYYQGSKKNNCKEKIFLILEMKGLMYTAYNLHNNDLLKNYTLSTIKSNLSKLKKENKICIGFRTRGKMTNQKNLYGENKFISGKTYYKINEK